MKRLPLLAGECSSAFYCATTVRWLAAALFFAAPNSQSCSILKYMFYPSYNLRVQAPR